MADRLILHFDGDQAAWIDETGALTRGSLVDAAQAAGERETVVLLPAEDILLTRVRLPPIRQARRRLQAARYALEDQLVARVDSLHFGLAARADGDGETAVAITNLDHLRAILDACREAGLDVVQLGADALALPLPDPDQWQVAVLDNRVLTRTSSQHGFAAEHSLWPTLAAGSYPAPERIQLSAAHNDDTEALTADLDLESDPEIDTSTHGDADAVLTHLLANADTPLSINLRQGEFARASTMQTWWHPFKLTAGLAAAWLVLAIAARGIESWQLSQRIDALHQTSESAFRDAFPEVETINDLRVQAEQKIRGLRGQGGSDGIFSLLQATAEVTGQVGDIRVQSLQFRDSTLYLSLRGDNVQALEALRAGFASQPQTALKVESADAAADGVQIRASVSGAAT